MFLSFSIFIQSRARNKALEREDEDLNEMKSQYLDLLETLDPSAARKYKTRERAAQSALEYEKLKQTERYIQFSNGMNKPLKRNKGDRPKSRKLRVHTRESSSDHGELSESDRETKSSKKTQSSRIEHQANESKSNSNRRILKTTSEEKELVSRKLSVNKPTILALPQPIQKAVETAPPKLILQPLMTATSPERPNDDSMSSPAVSVVEDIPATTTDPRKSPSPDSTDQSISEESHILELPKVENHGTTWPLPSRPDAEEKELSPSLSDPAIRSEPQQMVATGTLNSQPWMSTGMMSVDSLALDTKKVDSEKIILSGDHWNNSIDDHEEIFERSKHNEIFPQSPGKNEDFDHPPNDSISEIEIYLPLQNDHDIPRKTRLDITTGNNGLHSEVVKFIQEEEVLHQNESSPHFRQTFHSKDDGDDVLLGTNLLQRTYGTVSSFDSDPLTPQRGNTSPTMPTHSPSTTSFNEVSPTENIPSNDSKNIIQWKPGRAPLELIETANALDIFVSAVRIDSSGYSSKVSYHFSSQ